MENCLTIAETLERLNISDDTLRVWGLNGKIKTFKVGRTRYVPIEEIERIEMEKIPDGMKLCKICNTQKLVKDCMEGRNRCIDCHFEIERGRYHREKDKNRNKRLIYREGNRDNENNRARTWYKNNKDRVKTNNLIKRYGLTKDEYVEMGNIRLWKCEICNEESKRLVIDHDHNHENPNTKEAIRGMVCNNCNSAMGFVNDDIEVLKNMIKYLEKYNLKTENNHTVYKIE